MTFPVQKDHILIFEDKDAEHTESLSFRGPKMKLKPLWVGTLATAGFSFELFFDGETFTLLRGFYNLEMLHLFQKFSFDC